MRAIKIGLALAITTSSMVTALQQGNNANQNQSGTQQDCPTFANQAAIDKFLGSMIGPGKKYNSKTGSKFGFTFESKFWQMDSQAEQNLRPFYTKSTSKENKQMGGWGVVLHTLELAGSELVPADNRAGKRIRCNYKASGSSGHHPTDFTFTMTHIFQ